MHATLDRFVAGSENALVLRAIRRLVDDPTALPSPILLTGPASCGKSHLIGGLAAAARRRTPGLGCMLLDADGFTNRVRRAARDRSREALGDELGGLQLLCLDQVDRLAGRQKSQSALVRILDRLHDRGATAVLAARSRPTDTLSRELADRLGGGVRLRVDPAAIDTRGVLVRRALHARGVELPQAAVEQIARGLPDLGSLTPLVELLTALRRRQPTLSSAHVEAVLAEMGHVSSLDSPAGVASAIERYLGLDMGVLAPRRGPRQRDDARRLAWRLCQDLGLQRPDVASYFDVKPDSISAGLRLLRIRLLAEPELARLYANLRTELGLPPE